MSGRKTEGKQVNKHDSAAFKHIEIAVILVVGLWLLWGVAGVHVFREYICPGEENNCAVYGQVGDIFGGVNALFQALALAAVAIGVDVARRAYLSERQRDHDAKFVEQARLSYEWAYNALTGSDDSMPPKASRLNWLVAARHLLRAEKIAKQIESPAYKAVLDEHTEFWRHQFYTALDLSFADSFNYFVGDDNEDRFGVKHGLGVHVGSAMVICKFSTWDDDVVDPISMLNHEELKAFTRKKVGGIFKGLNRYLDHLDDQARRKAEVTVEPE